MRKHLDGWSFCRPAPQSLIRASCIIKPSTFGSQGLLFRDAEESRKTTTKFEALCFTIWYLHGCACDHGNARQVIASGAYFFRLPTCFSEVSNRKPGGTSQVKRKLRHILIEAAAEQLLMSGPQADFGLARRLLSP